MNTNDFDYDLPKDLIAQEPSACRDRARMMVLHVGGELEHRHVSDLPEYLAPSDILVVNNTRVMPWRVYGRREDTGGRVELLFLGKDEQGGWDALYKASGRARPGLRIELADKQALVTVVDAGSEGHVRLEPAPGCDLATVLDDVGAAPLPPYIKRQASDDGARVRADHERYQTVYASEPGAVAAPTAGLHFTEELLAAVDAVGVARVAVTLHVGPGTFRPVRTDCIDDHVMERERYVVPPRAAEALEHVRVRGGGRVVAVGSTTVRTLETVAAEHGRVVACAGHSSLFIHPPYAFRTVQALLTNFHLPRSTLLMMIAAFAGWRMTQAGQCAADDAAAAGHRRALAAYEEAIRARYRFYSYGDAMLIL